MSQPDVIIVGGGQAGCAAAWDLAAAGRRVLMLHREGGRAKPCAGGLTSKALARYRFSVNPVLRDSFDRMAVSRWLGPTRHLTASAPFCAMTDRGELDRFCLEKVKEKGVDVVASKAITAVHQDRDQVEVRGRDGRTWRAAHLIAADGANSPVARLLGVKHSGGAVAIEGCVARDQLSHYPTMTMNFGAIKGGYGWLFPKGDHVNVGLYVWRQGVARPQRTALAAYTEQALGIADANQALSRVAGFPLGTWLPTARLTQGRVLFVGDAAGCTEPLMGEGIYGALLSGQWAAQALLTPTPAWTYRAAMAAWREELAQVHRLGQLFYRALPFSVRLLQGRLGPFLVDGFARGQTLGQCKRQWRGAAALSLA